MGVWDFVGQVCVIMMVGGGCVCEELISVDLLWLFGYMFIDIKGLLVLLVVLVEGKWSFVFVDIGIMVIW